MGGVPNFFFENSKNQNGLGAAKNFFDHEREKTSKEGRGAVLGGLKQSVKKKISFWAGGCYDGNLGIKKAPDRYGSGAL